CFCFCLFKAEDGIRAPLVTGVQTCALPIFAGTGPSSCTGGTVVRFTWRPGLAGHHCGDRRTSVSSGQGNSRRGPRCGTRPGGSRSEERRGGKGGGGGGGGTSRTRREERGQR